MCKCHAFTRSVNACALPIWIGAGPTSPEATKDICDCLRLPATSPGGRNSEIVQGVAISRKVFTPASCTKCMAGATAMVNLSAVAFERAFTASRASARREFPSRMPRALAAHKAALVRSLMILCSRSASAAQR